MRLSVHLAALCCGAVSSLGAAEGAIGADDAHGFEQARLCARLPCRPNDGFQIRIFWFEMKNMLRS
jgi:hypothetical protein